MIAQGAAFSVKDLALDGGTLIKELGVKPGPDIGRVLRALLEEVVEDPSLNSRDTLLARARELLQQAEPCRMTDPRPLPTDQRAPAPEFAREQLPPPHGRHLIDPKPTDLWLACWTAPRVIVAHGTEADPIFFYGNQLALGCFEMDFATFTRLPSRYSAEPLLREERDALLARVREHGFIDDYAGVRVSASGRRFRIEQAVVWNLLDEAGQRHGQAATFERWLAV